MESMEKDERPKKVVVFKFDEEGFYLYPVEHLVDTPMRSDTTDVNPLSRGFCKPRLVNGEWVEGATQEEIDELTKPQPVPPSQTELLEHRLADLELTIVEMMFK